MKLAVFFACAVLSFAIPLHAQQNDEYQDSQGVEIQPGVPGPEIHSASEAPSTPATPDAAADLKSASAALDKEMADVSPPSPDTSLDRSPPPSYAGGTSSADSGGRKYKARFRVGDHHAHHRHAKTKIASKSHHKKIKVAAHHHHPSHYKVRKVAHAVKKHGRWICTAG